MDRNMEVVFNLTPQIEYVISKLSWNLCCVLLTLEIYYPNTVSDTITLSSLLHPSYPFSKIFKDRMYMTVELTSFVFWTITYINVYKLYTYIYVCLIYVKNK